MRNIPSGVLNQITSGSEPVFVVGIVWNGTTPTYYATKDNIGICLPYVISVAEIETVTRLDGGAATSFEMVFDDSSAHFKGIFDSLDIHFRPIAIYQYFDGMGSGLFPIFYGQLSTPIVWDEGQRTFSMSALTRESNLEVGFSVEEGQFPKIHESLIGQPWPLGFGTPIHVPGLALQQSPTGMILKPFGIPDPTIQMQINKLVIKTSNLAEVIALAFFYQAHAAFQGDDSLSDQWGAVATQAQIQQQDAQAEVLKLTLVLNQQKAYALTENYVIGGYRFPQNKSIRVKVNEFLFHATFHGHEGPYQNATPNNFDTPCRVTLIPILPPILQGINLTTGELEFEKQSFTYIQAGSQVTIIDDYPIDYVANCLPSAVRAVYAYRAFNGKKQLTLVPSTYYMIIDDSYQGFTGPIVNPTVIRMKRPLSTIAFYDNLRTTRAEDLAAFKQTLTGVRILPHIVNNIDWDDQIYVTYDSPVGPNVVDILIWLIQHYTGYTYDTTSFAAIRTQVAEYPANFAIFDRPLVDQFLGDIAYQARCRLYIKDNTYFLKFLAIEGISVDTITLGDIEEGTLQIKTTETEALVTKYVATWKPDYVKPEARIIIRHNAGLQFYGIQEQTYNYFIYNDRQLVERVATFWSIRLSNTWKLVECTLQLNKLNLETNDTVTLDLSNYISTDPVTATIESCAYDLESYSIKVSLWTPVRAGELTPYQFAFPAGLSETIFYPTFNEITSGAAGGLNQGVAGQLPSFYQGGAINWPDALDDSNEQAPDEPRDFGTRQISDAGYVARPGSIPSSPPVLFGAEPTFDYEYTGFPPLPAISKDPDIAVYPGQIVSGSGTDYQVKIWKQGLSGKNVTIPAKQLMIDGSETIPADVWVHVVMNKDKKGRQEYTIQSPVWLPES